MLITGDIKYFTESVLDEKALSTLIADLGENAIISIGNVNRRNILLSIGVREGTYAIDLFDSGTPFDESVIKNLGIKRYTTHKAEGGSGIGLMTTFEILKEHNASFEIEELESNELYTKRVAVIFDNKSAIRIFSKRSTIIAEVNKRKDIILAD